MVAETPSSSHMAFLRSLPFHEGIFMAYYTQIAAGFERMELIYGRSMNRDRVLGTYELIGRMNRC